MRSLARLHLDILSKPRRRRSDSARKVPDAEQTFIDDLDAVLWEADPETFQFTFVSQGAERLLGFPVSDWLTEQDFWARHIHADDRDEAVTHCVQATREGRDHEFQYRMVAADGSLRTVRDFVRVHTDEAGRPTRLFGVLVDVTERGGRARADALPFAVTAPASAASAAAGNVPARILILEDDSDDALQAERAIRKALPNCVLLVVQTGTDFDRALWEFAPDVILSDHKVPQFGGREALRLARARTPATPFILLTGSLDEETAVEYMKAGAADYVLKDRLARLGHTVTAALDQRRQREEYARAEAQFRDIFLRAPIGIARATADGQLITANPELVRMLGYDATVDLTALNIARDVYASEAERERVVKLAATSGNVSDIEMQWKRKDGRLIWVQLSMEVERDASGNIRYLQTFVRDVTEQKLLSAQLRQAQRMEALGQLAGGVVHDFNNILTVVLAASELMLNDLAPTDSMRADVDEIRNAARHGADLTRQLLAFSRKQVLSVQPIDLNTVVTNVERMLRRLLGADVELRLSLAPDLGIIMADPGQIEQVLMNLVVNARDAIQAENVGVITIETANENGHVTLSVIDTGVGMDAETSARIFEPFFTTKEPGKGTGLGLATVYGIVQQSGGEMHVESAPGHGTTIKASIPRVSGTQASHEATQELKPGNETVLLVEDDRVVRTLANRILTAAGYRVLEASNGPEALQIARTHDGQIHLLLTDVVMPEMNGVAVANQLRAERATTPVLYMSGYPAGSHGEQVLTSSDHYLLKPFTSEGLRRKVRELLDG